MAGVDMGCQDMTSGVEEGFGPDAKTRADLLIVRDPFGGYLHFEIPAGTSEKLNSQFVMNKNLLHSDESST
jgi:hypothetical protein